MSARASIQTVRTFGSRLSGQSKACRRSFTTSFINRISDPATALSDAINPGKTRPPPQTPVASRSPSQTADGTNPSLLGFPTASAPRSAAGDRSHDALSRIVRDNMPQRSQYQNQAALREQQRALEQQSSRSWRDGDVYAPHDLSPAEMQKARRARSNAARGNTTNTRKKGGRDLVDELAINPLKEYKNFAMMSEFMTDMGRIKHGKETGLRAVNQRKVARAIRRAIGIGIMPSVHKHPELFDERVSGRRNA